MNEYTTPQPLPLVLGDRDSHLAQTTSHENYSAGPALKPESSVSISRFDDYKLETEFHDGYVVHRTHKWDLSMRVWETATWKEEGFIGSGRFGSVSLQKRQEKGGGGEQLRAIKMIPQNPFLEGGFSQELLAFVKLKDYGHLFVKFFGWYENKDNIFLAMEYIEYGDLAGYMLRDPLKARAGTNEIARQVLEGLEVLHGKGICHRDLKPQNILLASIDPLWVKIADFGLSKRIKNTIARTICGTQGYLAPELLGVLPQQFKTRKFIPHALDIWSLGSLVHELLTSKTPFALSDEYDSDPDILPPEPAVDLISLREYCHGDIEFPIEVLRESGVGKEEIDFVKSLLTRNPKDRPTATRVLQNPWLSGYKSDWFETLKGEFSRLGRDLDLKRKGILVRQAHKADILDFLPVSAKDEVPSLLLEAVGKGYKSATLMLLQSTSREPIDCFTSGELFRLATEAKKYDMIKLLLHNKVDVGARINDLPVLQWVAKSGHVSVALLLLESRANIGIKNCREAFQLAVKEGHTDVVKALLGKIEIHARLGRGEDLTLHASAAGAHTNTTGLPPANDADLNAVKYLDEGRVALQMAVKNGHIDIVKVLLDTKVNVNATIGGSDLTTLQMAARHRHTEIFKLLLDNGADVNITAGNYGPTVLEMAAMDGYTDIVKLLLDNKEASMSATTGIGLKALQAAARHRHTEIVKLLLDNEAHVNATAGTNGLKALQMAAKDGHTDIVKLLLDNKVDANATRETNDLTAMQSAIWGGHTGIVKLLLENKADVNATVGTNCLTALKIAAWTGHTEISKLLLDSKADVNAAVGAGGITAIEAAAWNGHIYIVKLLLDSNADVNATGWAGESTALKAAATTGYIDIVRLLLKKGACVNPSTPGTRNLTALQRAALNGHIDIVKLLLDNKADVDAKSGPDGRTALEAAAWNGYIDIVRLLLDKGACVNSSTAETGNLTALQGAALNGHIDIVKLLLDKNADVNAESGPERRTALQAAVWGGYIDIVKLLLENKADVNAVAGTNGSTALQAAAWSGNIDIVKLLLDNEADLNAMAGTGGMTALEAAAHNIDIFNLLRDKQAEINAKTAERQVLRDKITEINAMAAAGRRAPIQALFRDIYTRTSGSYHPVTLV